MNPDAGRVVDGVQHRRRGDVHRQLADSLGAVRRTRIRLLNEDGGDARSVERRRDQIGRQPVVLVAAIGQLDLFDRGVSDRLERPALHLALGQDRVDDVTDVVR